jgi:hypothetical protein
LIGLAILAPLWLVTLILSAALSPRTAPTPRSPLQIPERCVLSVTQTLSNTGLSAAASFSPDGTLLVTIPYDLAENAPQDEGAQAVWASFDAAAALPASCSFSYLKVTVWSGNLRLEAQVAAGDLLAWEEEELDNDDLAELVTYTQQIASPTIP